jgi:hypothetical protein
MAIMRENEIFLAGEGNVNIACGPRVTTRVALSNACQPTIVNARVADFLVCHLTIVKNLIFLS